MPELESSSADSHHARETLGSDRLIQSSLLDRTNVLGRPWQRPRPHIERLGEDIVNSISIHRLAGNGRDLDDDVVAILTNNDKTVRMYSLTRKVELKVDVFGFMMNHATISPDGKLLVIVGDRQEIFFNRRVERSRPHGFSPQHGLPSQYDWEQLRHFALYKPQHAEYSAYFTTAWSPDGKLCATASEDGYITVFDVDAIANEDPDIDPVVAIAPSSRKDTTPGAVRTMCFAPEPWDLLIWAEQNGRVCVGDLRQGLLLRQVVELNPRGGDVIKLNLTDTDSRMEDTDYRDLNLDLGLARRQHRSLFVTEDSHRSSTPTAQDMLDAQERRHLQREMGIPELDGEPQGLNEEERAILEGLRTSRQREEAITLGGFSGFNPSRENRSMPRSINYLNAARNGQYLSTGTSSSDELARLQRDVQALSSVRDALRDSSGPRRGSDGSSSVQPRRRNSIVISSSADPSAPRPTSSSTQDDDAWRTITNAFRSASRANAAGPVGPTRNSQGDPDDPYPDLPPLINAQDSSNSASREAANRPTSTTTAITLPSIRDRPSGDNSLGPVATSLEQRFRDRERERDRERDIESRLRLRDAALMSRYDAGLMRRFGVRPMGGRMMDLADEHDWGVGTAGVAMSDEGRTL